MKVLEIENLCKKYKRFKLKDINLSLDEGFIMGLIGKNGSGKTTLLKLIMNLLLKTSGTIKVTGLDNANEEKKIKDMIGFIFIDYPFLLGTSLEKNGTLLGAYYSQWDQIQFLGYLEKYKLDKNKKYGELSKGMKTKFQLAFALAHNPRLLILDEPTAGLDPIFRREFVEILCDLIKDEKITILFSTHITSDLDKIADYITFIDKGEILFSDSKEELQEKYHLLKGPLTELKILDKVKHVGLKKYDTYFEALVEGKVSLSEDELLNINKVVPKIEEIMLFFCDDKLREDVIESA